MAAAVELSRSSSGDRSPERSCSPNLSQEVLREIFRSLHSLVGQLNLRDDVVKITIDWNKLQSLSAFQPALLFSALEQHVLYLQPFLAKLQPLIKEENTTIVGEIERTETGNKNEVNAKFPISDLQEEEKHEDCDLGDVKKTQIHFDPEVVQIKAGKAEIDRRISAFIERKQAEINENNVREFCNVIDCNQENSCARTDAIFTPYPGFKSHVKEVSYLVSRVVNTYGPQTRPEGIQGSGHKPNSMLRDCGNQAVEERLQNIEAHLRLQTGGPVPRDIYQRIKKLEDKILELEGISPEYFQSVQNYSLAELDEKISALKQALLRKSREAESLATHHLP
ncbi:MAP3K12-binding inhibitory protein 1 isoform X5 [Vulpes vulpes]|uniref:MAP3K12-binding inhibitory protein 1 isoform X5 n=1 Tax=Vulpes vulpes TaxID=9627 RepID=A0A3Q7TYH1_VULVU|nr:MAP3K12-binding inhibitory protein 1 isoform X5 [Canis lupus dingo]XP_025874808.1 MAP3K12-binding inhibitory protein 1 isoform X5 [Vulpes vulpes]XP_038529379.1 MAP3K12-binding inhibitory protein 1 isoform X5 [Canis lupus familiaris]XP_041615630.1 MAP3K12-binding inhibitory protein 1 isoform X5 [Vulpes lagopus]